MEYYHSEWLNSLIVLKLPSDAFSVDRMIVKGLENNDERCFKAKDSLPVTDNIDMHP